MTFDSHDCPLERDRAKQQVTIEKHPATTDEAWMRVTCAHCGEELKPFGTVRVWINGEPRWATVRI